MAEEVSDAGVASGPIEIVNDSEPLFRFILAGEWSQEFGEARVNSSAFKTAGGVVSVNRGSIWGLDKHLSLAEDDWGICAAITEDVRRQGDDSCIVPNGDALDIYPDPGFDGLLGMDNPSHANFSRRLTNGEAKRAARLFSRWMPKNPSNHS